MIYLYHKIYLYQLKKVVYYNILQQVSHRSQNSVVRIQSKYLINRVNLWRLIWEDYLELMELEVSQTWN